MRNVWKTDILHPFTVCTTRTVTCIELQFLRRIYMGPFQWVCAVEKRLQTNVSSYAKCTDIFCESLQYLCHSVPVHWLLLPNARGTMQNQPVSDAQASVRAIMLIWLGLGEGERVVANHMHSELFLHV